jgi:hypothetical protein
MKKIILSVLFSLILAVPSFALQCNLAWSAVTTFTDGTTIPTGTTVFYNVFRATKPDLSDAIKLNISGVTLTTYSDSTIVTGRLYYYYTQSYINASMPSGNSNVVSLSTLVPSNPSGLSGTIAP